MEHELTLEETRQQLIKLKPHYTIEQIDASVEFVWKRMKERKAARSKSGVEKNATSDLVDGEGTSQPAGSTGERLMGNDKAEIERKRKEEEETLAKAEEKRRKQEEEAEKERLRLNAQIEAEKMKMEKEVADRAEAKRKEKEAEAEKERVRLNAQVEAEKAKMEKEVADRAEAKRKEQEAEAEKERLSLNAQIEAEKAKMEKKIADRAEKEHKRKAAEEREQQLQLNVEKEEILRRIEKKAADRAAAKQKEQEADAEKERLERKGEAGTERRRNETKALDNTEADRSNHEEAEVEKKRLRKAQIKAEKMKLEKAVADRDEAKRKEQEAETEKERLRLNAQIEAEKMRLAKKVADLAEAERRKQETGAEEKRQRRNSQAEKSEKDRRRVVEAETEQAPQGKEEQEYQRVAESKRERNASRIISSLQLLSNRQLDGTVTQKFRMDSSNISPTAGRPEVYYSRAPGPGCMAPEDVAEKPVSPLLVRESRSLRRKEEQKRELRKVMAAFGKSEEHEPQFLRKEKGTVMHNKPESTSTPGTRPLSLVLNQNDAIEYGSNLEIECNMAAVNNRMNNPERIRNVPSTTNNGNSGRYIGLLAIKSQMEVPEELHDQPEKLEAPNQVSIAASSERGSTRCSLSPLDSDSDIILSEENDRFIGDERLLEIISKIDRPENLDVHFYASNSIDQEERDRYPPSKLKEMMKRNKHGVPNYMPARLEEGPHVTYSYGNGYVKFELMTEERQQEVEEPETFTTRTRINGEGDEEVQITAFSSLRNPKICQCSHNLEAPSKEKLLAMAFEEALKMNLTQMKFDAKYIECISEEALEKFRTCRSPIPWLQDKRYAKRKNLDIFEEHRERDLKQKKEKELSPIRFLYPGPVIEIPEFFQLRDLSKYCDTCKGRLRSYYKPIAFKPFTYLLHRSITADPDVKHENRVLRFRRRHKIQKLAAAKLSRAQRFFDQPAHFNELFDPRRTFIHYHKRCLEDFPDFVPESVREFFNAFSVDYVLNTFEPIPEGNERGKRSLSRLMKEMDRIDKRRNKKVSERQWTSVTVSDSELEEDLREVNLRLITPVPSPRSEENPEGEKEELLVDPMSLTASKEIHFAAVTATFKVPAVARKTDKSVEEEERSDESTGVDVERVPEPVANEPTERVYGEDELLSDPIDDGLGIMNSEADERILDEPIPSNNEEPMSSVIENAESVENVEKNDQPRALTPVQLQDLNVNNQAKSPAPDLLRESSSNPEVQHEMVERFDEDELLRSVSPSDPIPSNNQQSDELDITMDSETSGNIDPEIRSLSPQAIEHLSPPDMLQAEQEHLKYTEEDLLGEYGQLEEVNDSPVSDILPVEPAPIESDDSSVAETVKKAVNSGRGRTTKPEVDEQAYEAVEVETGNSMEPVAAAVMEDTPELANEATQDAVIEKPAEKSLVVTEVQSEAATVRGLPTTTNTEEPGTEVDPNTRNESVEVTPEEDTSVRNSVSIAKDHKIKRGRPAKKKPEATEDENTQERDEEPIDYVSRKDEAGPSNPVASPKVQEMRKTRRARSARNAKLEVKNALEQVNEPVGDAEGEKETGVSNPVITVEEKKTRRGRPAKVKPEVPGEETVYESANETMGGVAGDEEAGTSNAVDSIQNEEKKETRRTRSARNAKLEVKTPRGKLIKPIGKAEREEETNVSNPGSTVKEQKIDRTKRGRVAKSKPIATEEETASERTNEPIGDVVGEDEASTSNPNASSEIQEVKRTRRTRSARNAKSKVGNALAKVNEPAKNLVEDAAVEEEAVISNAGPSGDAQKSKEEKRRPARGKPTPLDIEDTPESVDMPVEDELEGTVGIKETNNSSNPVYSANVEKPKKNKKERAVITDSFEPEAEEPPEQVDVPIEDPVEDTAGEEEEEYEKPVSRKRARNEDAPFLPANATRTKRHFLSKNNPVPRFRRGVDNEPTTSDDPVRLTGVVNKNDAALLGDGKSENFKKLPMATQKLLNFEDSPEKKRRRTGESSTSEEVEVKTEPDDEDWAIPDPIGDNTRKSRKRIREEKERSILANIKREIAPDDECQVLMTNVNQVKEEVEDPEFQVLSVGFNKKAVDPEEEAPPFKEINEEWAQNIDHRYLMLKFIWNEANEIFTSDPAKFSKLMLIIANDNQTIGRVFKYSATVEDRFSKFDPALINLLASSSRNLTDEQKLCLDYNTFSTIYRNTASQTVTNHKVTPYSLHKIALDIQDIKKAFTENARSSMDGDDDSVNATEAILLGQFIACCLKMAGLSSITWATATHIHRRLEMIYYGWMMFLRNGGFLRVLLSLDRPDVKPLSDRFRKYCNEYLEEIEANYERAVEIVRMSDDEIMEHFREQTKLSKEEFENLEADIKSASSDTHTMRCVQCSSCDINAWFSDFSLKIMHSRYHNIDTHNCERCYDEMNDLRFVLHRVSVHNSLRTTNP